MAQGKVKWFNSKKGYGFIEPEDGSDDIFVHYTGIEGDEEDFKIIYEDDIVEYSVVDGKKGPQASEVKVVKKGPRKKNFNRGSYY